MVAVQNMSQLKNSYSHLEAEEIQESFANYFIGRDPLKSAQYLSELMGKKETESTSTTESDKKVSKTTHQRENAIVTPQEVMNFKKGEFMGNIVHHSGGFFKMKLQPLSAYHRKLSPKYFKPLPTVCEHIDIDANFKKIKRKVEETTRL